MSNYDLKKFMISGLKKNDTLTFKGIDTFKDENGVPIPLKFKQISRTEVEDIRKKFVHKTPAVDKEGNYIIRNGRIINDIDVDYDSFTDELIVETMVQPEGIKNCLIFMVYTLEQNYFISFSRAMIIAILTVVLHRRQT